MILKITLKLELLKPTLAKQRMYLEMTKLNTQFANWLLEHPEMEKPTSKVYSQFSNTRLPSAVVNQTIREVASKQKHQGAQQFRRLWCEFNNQNLHIEQTGNMYTASFPTQEKRIGVPLVVTPHQKKYLDALLNGEQKQGSGKLIYQRGKWYLLLSVTQKTVSNAPGIRVMGIDMGLRYLAVATIGSRAFFFKGNKAAYIRRRYTSLRKKHGKMKKLSAIRRLNNKEQRWIRDLNHKISRRIVNVAIANGVGIIRMEDLTNIRQTAKRRGKEQKSHLQKWGFYQLQQMVQYKANLAGIRIEYVNPQYTSQTCRLGHQDSRNREGIRFVCKVCGDQRHADVNGSMNIAKVISGLATKRSGKRSAAKWTTTKHIA